MRRFLADALGVVIFTPIFNWLLRKLPAKLGENAVLGWVDDRIAESLGLSAPSLSSVLSFLWEWGLPLVLAVAAVWLWHRFVLRFLSSETRPNSANSYVRGDEAAEIARSRLKDLPHFSNEIEAAWAGYGYSKLDKYLGYLIKQTPVYRTEGGKYLPIGINDCFADGLPKRTEIFFTRKELDSTINQLALWGTVDQRTGIRARAGEDAFIIGNRIIGENAPPNLLDVEAGRSLVAKDNISIKTPQPPAAEISAKSGTVTFDYSTHNGVVTLGKGDFAFRLKFSKSSNTNVQMLTSGHSGHSNVKKLARVKDATRGTILRFHQYDSSSTLYRIGVGEIFLAENPHGCFMQGKIVKIKDDTCGDANDEVEFEYQINTNGSAEFSAL